VKEPLAGEKSRDQADYEQFRKGTALLTLMSEHAGSALYNWSSFARREEREGELRLLQRILLRQRSRPANFQHLCILFVRSLLTMNRFIQAQAII